MSLWADKYRPNSLLKLDFHKEEALKLLKLSESGDLPHLLVYGPPGAGKKTRVMCLLRHFYGSGIDKLRIEHQCFETPSKNKLEITTIASNYHIEVNPSDCGRNDRIVVQNLIKTIAQSQQLCTSVQRTFKVIIIVEADRMSRDAQHALRRTMEKYSHVCRLVMIATSCGPILWPLRSRCLQWRVAAPSISDITYVLDGICKKEGVSLPVTLATRIAETSRRNLRRAILMCETCKVQQCPLSSEQSVTEPDWLLFLRQTAEMIVQEQSAKRLLDVRSRIYELLTHCIPADTIMQELLHELCKNCDNKLKCELVAHTASYEHRMKLGSKPVFHIEALVARFMAMYKGFVECSLMDLV